MAAFADDLVALFPHFDHSASPDDDVRECFCGDLAELGADAAVREFEKAGEILQGLMVSAEHINWALYVTMSDAYSRVRQARAVAEKHANRSATRE